MNRIDWRSMNRERQTESAFHEAGHAVMAWAFGDRSKIQFIDMQGKFGTFAYVQREWSNVSIICLRRLEAKRQLMWFHGGHAAEARRKGPTEWLENLLDAGDWEHDESHDLLRAVKVARAVSSSDGNAWRMVRLIARWADEAIADARVWSAVEALAKRLATIKRRLRGATACTILDKAWGEVSDIPYMDMGRKWRRRFSLKPAGPA